MDKGSRRSVRSFVPLPTAVVDEWLPRLTGSELKLLLVVIRQTEGFRDPETGGRKAEDWLTHRQLMAKTGCASQAVSGAVDALSRAGLVRVRAAGGGEADTPQRRRGASRLLYGLGPALLDHRELDHREQADDRQQAIHVSLQSALKAAALTEATLKSGLRKSKTTKERINKRDILVVFENQSAGQSSEQSRRRRMPPAEVGRDWVWRKPDARWVRAGEVD